MKAQPISPSIAEGRTIGINAHHFVDAAPPFGGLGQSGWGGEVGWSAIELYAELMPRGVRLTN